MYKYAKAWNKSYQRKENNIRYPYEELVKFLNRYPTKEGRTALDYGCGIGTQTQLLAEFGYKATGIDISAIAIKKAKEQNKSKDNPIFRITNGRTITQDYDLIISLNTLDSMPRKDAENILKQMNDKGRGYIFISLIKGNEHRQEVKKNYEKDTIQVFHNWQSIGEIKSILTNFETIETYLVQTSYIPPKIKKGRYYILLKRNEQ